MRVKLLLCLVVLCLAAVYVSAETVVVTSRLQRQIVGDPNADVFDVHGPDADAVGWLKYYPAGGERWLELQQHVEFDLTPYKDRANQLLSAKLSWRNESWLSTVEEGDWLGEGNYVEVDQVPSHTGDIAPSDFMWSGNPTMGKIASGLLSKNDQNDVNDRYEYDVTGQASEALQIAGSAQGIHFVWSNNNQEDYCVYNVLNNAAITGAPYDRFWGPNNDIPNPNSVEPALTLEFNGGTKTVSPVDIWRYVAFTNPAENVYHIGVQASDVLAGQTWSAWTQSGGWACEFRTVIEYDIQRSSLGLAPNAQILGAKLNFTTTPDNSAARDAVTVDHVLSWFGYGPAYADMYGYDMQLGIVTNGSTSGTYSVDITEMLKERMDASHESSGIAFRFSTDNDADPIAPWDPVNYVVNFYTGYTFSTPTIEITYIDTPPEFCGAYGTEYRQGDINVDCKVDFADLALMVAAWLDCTTPNDTNCSDVWYNQ